MEEERHYNEQVLGARQHTVSPVPYNPSPTQSRPLSPGISFAIFFFSRKLYSIEAPIAALIRVKIKNGNLTANLFYLLKSWNLALQLNKYFYICVCNKKRRWRNSGGAGIYAWSENVADFNRWHKLVNDKGIVEQKSMIFYGAFTPKKVVGDSNTSGNPLKIGETLALRWRRTISKYSVHY